MLASGVVIGSLELRLNWIARVKPVAATANRREAHRLDPDGAAGLLPQTAVDVTVTTAAASARRRRAGAAAARRSRPWSTGRAQPSSTIEFEFDAAEGMTAVTSIETAAHPNRPAGLPPRR